LPRRRPNHGHGINEVEVVPDQQQWLPIGETTLSLNVQIGQHSKGCADHPL
jgi:hypothetical protein